MKSSSNNKNTSLLAAVAGASAATATLACSYAVYRLYHAQKSKREQLALSKPLDDETRSTAVSHVHLQVEDLTKSKQFYLDFGLLVVEESENNEKNGDDSKTMCLMKVPSGGSKQPYLLLEENKQRMQRDGHAAAVGYARMCLLVEDCNQLVEDMKNKGGYTPIAPAVTDRPGDPKEDNPNVTIVAYADPDGNMVELVSLSEGMQAFMLKSMKRFGVVQFPLWVHVNINCTSYDTSWKAYEALGMVMETDYSRVENSLYQALRIPNPGIAKQVSLIKFPTKTSQFLVDLIEWENPKTKFPKATGSTMRLAIAVDDIALKLDELLLSSDKKDTTKPLWKLESTPTCVDLPSPLNRAVQCTISDPDGVLVDLVSFPERQVLLESNAKLLSCANNSNNKAILVTGCDTGFGRSVAVQMSGLGYKVIAVCFTQAGAKFLDSSTTLTVVADLTTEKGLKDVVDAVRAIVGSKHIKQGGSSDAAAKPTQLWAIVNNAGMHMPGHVEWTPPEAYKRVMELNFHAPVYLIHEFSSLLRQSKGRIVNVTSVCGLVASPSNSTYCASKFAMEALSDSLRVENKPFGVHVTVVEPTTMNTPLALDWYVSWEKNYKNANPAKKTMHSETWAAGYVQKGSALIKSVAEDPRITVGEVCNALVMPEPPARILSGKGAQGYKQFSRLPESQRDALFYIGPEPEQADKGNKQDNWEQT